MRNKIVILLVITLIMFGTVQRTEAADNGETLTLQEELEAFEQQHTHLQHEDFSEDTYMGRLLIPDVDLDVGVYTASVYDGAYNQKVCNAKDAAVWLTGLCPIIGDHNNQGFHKIKSAEADKTMAYIKNGDSIEAYKCVKIDTKGSNVVTGLLWSDGTNALYDTPEGHIVMYTCNKNWRSVTITEWVLVEE